MRAVHRVVNSLDQSILRHGDRDEAADQVLPRDHADLFAGKGRAKLAASIARLPQETRIATLYEWSCWTNWRPRSPP